MLTSYQIKLPLNVWRVGEMWFYYPHFASKEPRHRFSNLPKVMLEIDGRVGIKTYFMTACGLLGSGFLFFGVFF